MVYPDIDLLRLRKTSVKPLFSCIFSGDKTENRILVFTAYRLFIMTARVPAKVDNQFHYLDFRRVDSKRPNHIAFTFSDNKTYSFRPNLDQVWSLN